MIKGYTFSDDGLLRQALTHPSLDGEPSYQRLEFLGDRVLGLVIADYLYQTFPRAAEGQLNQRFIAMVRGATVADISRRIELDQALRMADGTEAEGGRSRDNVLEDVGEAVIGAIYLDGGLEAARAYVMEHWAHALTEAVEAKKDPKTELQEWLQARGRRVPTYKDIGRSGPDHDPLFVVRAETWEGEHADAEANSKKVAAQMAAASLLAALSSAEPQGKDRSRAGKSRKRG